MVEEEWQKMWDNSEKRKAYKTITNKVRKK